MSRDEKWKYVNGKLKEKVTTKTDSRGNREVVRQKASSDLFGRSAGSVISRTKYTR
jgi:hypothetical protein